MNKPYLSVGLFLLEITLDYYGEYGYLPPDEHCDRWGIYDAKGDLIKGKLHKNIKDKIKSKLKEENMSSDCCAAPCVPAKAYACKPTTAAPAGYYYTSSSTCDIAPVSTSTISLANLPPTVSLSAQYYVSPCSGTMPNKKDEQMFNSTSDLEIQQRNFLKTRARELEETKRSEARKAFNMDYVYIPKTKDEFLAALKSGSFTFSNDGYFNEAGENRYGYNMGSLMQYATFIDPKTPKDEAGYKVAKAKLAQALDDLKDTITVAPLTEAVAAFEVFKKATFH